MKTLAAGCVHSTCHTSRLQRANPSSCRPTRRLGRRNRPPTTNISNAGRRRGGRGTTTNFVVYEHGPRSKTRSSTGSAQTIAAFVLKRTNCGGPTHGSRTVPASSKTTLRVPGRHTTTNRLARRVSETSSTDKGLAIGPDRRSAATTRATITPCVDARLRGPRLGSRHQPRWGLHRLDTGPLAGTHPARHADA